MMAAVEKEMPQGSKAAAADRRHALLMRLAAPPAALAGARRSVPPGRAARLDWFLAEIDGIVLPRVLHLTTAGRDLARLVVSQRRLVTIEMPGRLAGPSDAAVQAQALAARLTEIAETRGEIAARLDRRAAPPGHAEIACSVASLRQALDPSGRVSSFDRLLSMAEAVALARLRWVEDSPQAWFSGAADWQAVLQAAAERLLTRRKEGRSPPRAGIPKVEGLLIPLGTDLALILATQGKQGFAAVLTRQAGLELIAGWQRF